ncbi:MAG: response regulator [Deltaproteobacteria bacterium]|nr:response regulator [Deltaproteobacteria bacterium]
MLRVLVVDDSRAMRAYVRGALMETLDCDVVEAASGFEALRLLPRDSYDVVVTDINMPDINGLELIRFVRNSDRHRKVPIIIISTQASDRDNERALELGADHYLLKPFKPEEIVDAVSSVLPNGDG